MNILAVERGSPLAINMNQPGSFLHWSIFTVSVATSISNPSDPLTRVHLIRVLGIGETTVMHTPAPPAPATAPAAASLL